MLHWGVKFLACKKREDCSLKGAIFWSLITSPLDFCHRYNWSRDSLVRLFFLLSCIPMLGKVSEVLGFESDPWGAITKSYCFRRFPTVKLLLIWLFLIWARLALCLLSIIVLPLWSTWLSDPLLICSFIALSSFSSESDASSSSSLWGFTFIVLPLSSFDELLNGSLYRKRLRRLDVRYSLR